MKVVKKKINWLDCMELSGNSFKLLNLMYYLDQDASDEVYLSKMGISLNTYKKAKKELISNGLLKVVQVGRHQYKYILGKRAIAEDDGKYELKYIITDMVENFRMMALREPSMEELETIHKDSIDIFNLKKDQVLLDEVEI